MDLRLVDEAAMPADLDAQIRQGLCACFPPDIPVFRHTRAWHGSSPEFTVVIGDGTRLAAHLGVVTRDITVGGRPLRVGGVQNVFVLHPYRGQGLTGRLSQAAMAEAQRRAIDLGLLFCVPALEKVYAACGWLGLGRRHVVRVDQGREIPLPEKNITMFYPLLIRQFPDGLIHLGGNDW